MRPRIIRQSPDISRLVIAAVEVQINHSTFFSLLKKSLKIIGYMTQTLVRLT